MKQALIICSGGLDSVTTAFYVKEKLKYDKLKILFFNYNQRTLKQERLAAKTCAKNINANFEEIDLSWLGNLSNSLINKKNKPKSISRKELKNTEKQAQAYYVPCRNTIFITRALAIVEANFVKNKIQSDIFLGFKNEGTEPYPDTTKEFVKKMNSLAKNSCVSKIKILAPLINKDKEDIIRLGKALGTNYEKTYTCYIGTKKDPKEFQHCGTCLSCRLRQEAFYWANKKDPTNYKTKMKDFRTGGKIKTMRHPPEAKKDTALQRFEEGARENQGVSSHAN